ncbi:MAG TPA: aminotransferase class III-fold pyridoxal phosphate-dependent enzyme, partial [Planctomycetes bacterium]|nr:aminotransferase class III-fold pyridoxal phosphate-dependent enzyme [Planctomycetota bacterium]
LPPEGFLAGLRDLATDHELLLVFDEVQTGCGRTGEWFGYQHFGVTPDVMTLAKSLCGGIAGGAMLTTAEIAPSLRPGMHAATFGGNPVAARAGIACIEMIEADNLLQNVATLSQLFEERLLSLKENCQWIREVRVIGMMIGIELDVEGTPVVEACMNNGLLVNCTQGNIVRLLPAMTLTEDQAEQGCQILADALQGLNP